MKRSQMVLLSLLVTLVLSAWVTWPLARNVHEGMPSSHRPEAGGPRYMIAGDHIQFLFQLWMFADAMAGKTPLFYHVYEFNQGDDAARYEPGSYYFPFGLIYAAGYALGGRAIGWNLMLLVSAWLAYVVTWGLARRFCRSPLTAAVAALPALLLPYFWACCLGGSPTGPGMMWVPVIFYGIDKAIRDRRVWGGVLAGVAIFMSPWADLHVFFFAFLVAPVWGMFCWAAGRWLPAEGPRLESADNQKSPTWLERVVPLLPLGILMGVAYLQTAMVKHSLSGTVQSAGRKASEASIYAPNWQGWVDWDPGNRHNAIYLGLVAVAVLGLGLALLLREVRLRQPGRWGRLSVYLLALAAIGALALLALGPNIPKDPHQRVWHLLRAVLPPYRMIRQPAKVYCVLAPFLSVALAMALDRLRGLFTHRSVTAGVTLALGAALAWDYGRRIEPTICLFDYEQGAYRAIADDAARSGRENRALSIPIWPGDSHWNSLTEYYATLYRTKMLNGYRPSVRRQYLEEIFERLAPMNIGYITEDRLDALLARKIGYLVLEEDAFPEKVSPFAVAHTLGELLRHPRVQFLGRDREIWAFKILGAGETKAEGPGGKSSGRVLLGGRAWRAMAYAGDAARVRRDAPGDAGYVHLESPAEHVTLPPRQFYDVAGLRYLVTARGTGQLVATLDLGPGNGTQTVTAAVAPQWGWIELPLPPFQGVHDVGLTLSATHGAVDVDRVTFVAGSWTWLEPGQKQVLPAHVFFRAGYSDLRDGSVHLSAARDPAAAVFYAPYLALRSGRYRVTVDCATSAPAGTELGELSMAPSGGSPLATVPVLAGSPVALEFTHAVCTPLRLEIGFTRKGDLTIRAVTFERVE